MKLLVLFGISIALPYVMGGRKCLGKFSKGEELPGGDMVVCYTVTGIGSDDDKNYCVEMTCPSLNCTDPITLGGGCPYCKGTCVIGDQVVTAGETITCEDGCNRCECDAYDDGSSGVTTTLIMCSFSDPPVECKDLA